MANVFFSYSHKDKKIREEIDKHFSVLKRSNIIEIWYDNEIPAGDDFDHAIKEELEKADIILLLVSADFLHSSYCQDVEMRRALQKYRDREASVVPIIVDICDWKHTELKNLKSLPTDGKEITKHGNRKEAYQNITDEIRELAHSVNEPVRYYAKKAIYKSPAKVNYVISYTKNSISFISKNIKKISILLVVAYVFFTFVSSCSKRVEIEGVAFNISDPNLSVEVDLNKDGYLDKISFIDWQYTREQQGLYIFLTNPETKNYKHAIHKTGGIWNEGNPPGDIWLSINSSNSLVVNFNEFMSSELRFKVIIAFRKNNLVVAGYMRQTGENVICDINYLSGTHIISGITQNHPKQFIDLKQWHIGLLPAVCR